MSKPKSFAKSKSKSLSKSRKQYRKKPSSAASCMHGGGCGCGAKLMNGGNFSNNFNTYLDRVSPDAYIPFNVATGNAHSDPIAPTTLHATRLDLQKPTTPMLMGGSRRRRRQNKKSKGGKSRKMRGGGGTFTDLFFGSYGPSTSVVSDNPVFAAINVNNAPTLANISTGTNGSMSSNLTYHPYAVSSGSIARLPMT
jgi:hypothetical protein